MLNHKNKIIASTLAATVAMFTPSFATPDPKNMPEMTLYKDPNCGCCTAHADYLKENGFKVTMIDHPNIVEIKQQYGTLRGASCHTIVMDGYVIEGHVPVASIKKLWAEQPDIKGIALPGMPYNSPGMG
ncbi:DUF411 domain-containing protein, partial [Wohlfahrtiimonas larvae]